MMLGLVWAAGSVAAQERRVVAVNVVDEKGEPVVGLGAENFRGKYRGEPVRIVSAEWDTGPRRIVIVLDVSESMDGAPGKWSYAQTAFQGLIANGPDGARLALVTFDGAPEKRIGFEEWSAEAGLALGELERPRKMERGAKPLGLLGAMKAGLGLLGEVEAGDVFFVITDGWRTPEEGGEELRSVYCGGMRVFTFDFFVRGGGGANMSGLAAATGGEALHAVFGGAIRDRVSKAYVPLEGVPESLVKFYQQMGEFYRVEVELPREVDKAREWELEVVDAAGKKRKDVRVVYPRRLAPCGAESGS